MILWFDQYVIEDEEGKPRIKYEVYPMDFVNENYDNTEYIGQIVSGLKSEEDALRLIHYLNGGELDRPLLDLFTDETREYYESNKQ